MSDFDKEAERERLREKYETEDEDRESTERMSELLLKGATMTNAHCGNCGDPIFRYDGEEFCPTCQEVVTEADQTGAAHPENGDGDEPEDVVAPGNADTVRDPADAPTESEAPAQQAERDGETQPVETEPPTQQGEPGTRSDTAEQPDEPRADTLPAETGERSPATPTEREQRPTTPSPPARPETPNRDGAAGNEIAAARESLERTLVRFSRRAEEAEDPRRARDNLEAASEAAEALAALSEIR